MPALLDQYLGSSRIKVLTMLEERFRDVPGKTLAYMNRRNNEA